MVTNRTLAVAWDNMMARCYRPSCNVFHHYGARGITVCERWRTSRAAFIEDMGPTWRHGLMLDRIDGTKGYSPDNCRWATRTEQNRNRRTALMLTHQGRTQNLTAWAAEIGMDKDTLWQRKRLYGWPDDKCLTTPVMDAKTRCSRAREARLSR